MTILGGIFLFLFLSSFFVLAILDCLRNKRRQDRFELRDIERTSYLASISNHLEDIKNSIDNLE